MAPKERKGEAARGRERERKRRAPEEGAPREAADTREDEGWAQPESSAQKMPEGAEDSHHSEGG